MQTDRQMDGFSAFYSRQIWLKCAVAMIDYTTYYKQCVQVHVVAIAIGGIQLAIALATYFA